MYGTTNVKSPNNSGKWQMGLNSAFKGLNRFLRLSRLFPIFVQVYLPLPSGGNSDAVNKYHNILLVDGKGPAGKISERHTTEKRRSAGKRI
jgi:hypothetical protein